tara:strand:- start:254 stop:712 length:459 start_codon:yes stop_codon:yes gene_type:complete
MAKQNSFFTIHGAKEVADELNELSRGINNQIIKPGLTVGAAHIRKIAKREAPKIDGHLIKAIQSKVFTAKSGGKGVFSKIGILKKSFTDENGTPVIKYAGEANEATDYLNKSIQKGQSEAIRLMVKRVQEKLDAFHAKRAAKAAAAAAKGRL